MRREHSSKHPPGHASGKQRETWLAGRRRDSRASGRLVDYPLRDDAVFDALDEASFAGRSRQGLNFEA
jgi:hypothetical protein